MQHRLLSDGPQVLFHFNPVHGNAFSQPAYLIFIQRLLEKARSQKYAYQQINAECSQLIHLVKKENVTLEGFPQTKAFSKELRLPAHPTFFKIKNEKGDLLAGACHFADAGEADFSKCESLDELTDSSEYLIELNRESDFLKPLWAVLLIAVCLLIWFLSERRRQHQDNPTEFLV